MFHTYKLWLVNGAVFALIMAIFFVDSFSGLSFGRLVLKGLMHAPWIAAVYLAVNFVFFRGAFKNAIALWRKKL